MSIQLPIPSRLKYEFAWIHPKRKTGPLLDQFIRFQHLKKTSIGFTKGNFPQRLTLEMLFKLFSLPKSLLCLQLCILLGDVTDGHVSHLGSAQPQRSFSDVSTMLFVIWRGYWIWLGRFYWPSSSRPWQDGPRTAPASLSPWICTAVLGCLQWA